MQEEPLKMSKPIDYSKWDKFQAEDSESGSDDDDGRMRHRPPQVTKFDVPMAVSFGGKPAQQTEVVDVMPMKEGEWSFCSC